MATIIQQPDSLSFSANLKRFEIAASADVLFKLSLGGNTIIEESYTPNSAGRVVVDVKEIIKSYLAFSLPSSNIFQQTSICKQFTVQIDALPSINFHVIRGGVENISDTAANFLSANWLSWQPQTKQTSYSQPEWLTYYAPGSAVVKVKYYFTDGTSAVISLHSPSAGTCYTYNMQFAHIMTLQAGEKYGYYDVWAENTSGQRLTYIQRYVYRGKEDADEYFLFENSIGGIDTAVLNGESVFSPQMEHTEGVYNDSAIQIDGKISRYFEKNTGWKPRTEADWLFDFFSSVSRYKLCEGQIRAITLKESSIDDSTQEDLKSFTFVYKFCEDRGLLNIARSMDAPPENLEITTPAGLFFLAPRLVDFPAAELEDTMLFPVQSPFSETWKKLSWAAVWNFLYDKIISSAIGLMAHVHDNLSILNKLSESAGKLNYNGEEIGGSGFGGVQLGETSQTAYRGDRGKAAYDHSQNADPHVTVEQKTQLGGAYDHILDTDPHVTVSQKNNWNSKPNLGETSATAYRGDRGKAAYDHSQNADPHVTVEQKNNWNSKPNLGETSATAYRGDRGKAAYDHTLDTDPHVTTQDKLKLSKAVISDAGNYKIWTGSAADYAQVTPDANTLYFIQ